MRDLSNSAMRDIETLIHPYTNLDTHRKVGPMVIERGEGVHVYDGRGKAYVEGMAGLWCTSLGYGNEELIEAASTQMRALSFSHIFGGKSHEPAIAVAEKLKEMIPFPVSKVMFTSSGSEANDSQIKLAWYYNNARGLPLKKKIISRIRAYHGVTIASASLTGLPNNHRDFDLPIDRVLHTSCPHYYRFGEAGESEEDFASRMAADLDQMIQKEGPDTVAAFIAEPVMGAGGVIIPPATYFDKIQAVLEKYDILLIADEVICGFGRTGNLFGSETYGVRPDSISIAKALTSAYLPLGAVTVGEPVYQAMLEESRKIGQFGHGFTYSGHPVACAVALKTLEIYQRDDIVGQVKKASPHFLARIAKLGEHPLVGNARGVGLIGAVELAADKTKKQAFDPAKTVAAKAVSFIQDEGVLLRNLLGDVIAFCPPLVIKSAEIDEMFDGVTRGLDKAFQWVKAEGLVL